MLCWIHRMQRTIFQSLPVSVNINRQHGQVSSSISNYWSSCFPVGSTLSFTSRLRYARSSLSVGIYYCFKDLTDANIFIIIYGMTSIYFAVRMKYYDDHQQHWPRFRVWWCVWCWCLRQWCVFCPVLVSRVSWTLTCVIWMWINWKRTSLGRQVRQAQPEHVVQMIRQHTHERMRLLSVSCVWWPSSWWPTCSIVPGWPVRLIRRHRSFSQLVVAMDRSISSMTSVRHTGGWDTTLMRYDEGIILRMIELFSLV